MLVNEGKILIEAPAKAVEFGEDGRSIVLNDGRVIRADAIVLATGYESSWTDLFDGMCICYDSVLYVAYSCRSVDFAFQCKRSIKLASGNILPNTSHLMLMTKNGKDTCR